MSKKEVSVLVKPSATADSGTTRAIDDLRKEVQAKSFTDGSRLLEGIELAAGVNRIPHGLGKRPKGYLVVGARKVAPVPDYVIWFGGESHSVGTANDYAKAVGSSGAFHTGAPGNYPIPYDGHVCGIVYRAGAGHITGTVEYRARITGVSYTAETLLLTTGVAQGSKIFATPQPVTRDVDRLQMNVDIVGVVTSATFVLVGVLMSRSDVGLPALYDEHDIHTDTDTFLYLVAPGVATVDLLIF